MWRGQIVVLSLLFSGGDLAELRASDPATVIPSPVVVFNSFGAGDTHTTTGWGVSGGSTSGGYRGQAEWFVPNVPGDLSSVQVALFRTSGTGLSTFFLAQDDGGIPGSILEKFPNVLSTGALLSLNSIQQPLLDVGSKYWLCAEPADSTTSSGWYQNNQGLGRGYSFERSEWGWSIATDSSHNAAFRVSVTPVPEPSTWALTLLGGLTVAGMKRLTSLQRKSKKWAATS